jgi:hypothetical protein
MVCLGGKQVSESKVVVYQCIVCGRSFTKKESLMAHMRVHKDADLVVFNVKLPRELVVAFKDLCERHHTTTCHLVATFMRAALAGDKTGLVNIGAANPLIVTVQSFFGAKPRGHGKYDVAAATPFAGSNPPVLCLYMDGVDGDQVFCQKRGGLWLPLSVCSTCPKNRFQKKGEV